MWWFAALKAAETKHHAWCTCGTSKPSSQNECVFSKSHVANMKQAQQQQITAKLIVLRARASLWIP
jgi:hypothetical protein